MGSKSGVCCTSLSKNKNKKRRVGYRGICMGLSRSAARSWL